MKRGIFLASIALSVTLIAVGLLRGDPARVFANAVVVCLSCIGIQ
ncbi:MAG: CD1871A family CXXC motif-containing protein [Betaproteobacteria bacterium]